MGRLKRGFQTLRSIYREWTDDDAQTWAASVAFYTIFSLAPLLVLAVAIAGFVFGRQAAQGELTAQVQGLTGNAGADVLQSTIAHASEPSGGGIVATIVSIVLLFLGASKVFAELQQALNRIWDVRAAPEEGWRGAVRKRLIGFGMVLGIGLFLILTVAASVFLTNIERFIGQVPGGPFWWSALNFVVSIAIITVLFAGLFRYVPDVRIAWRDVWFGAAITAALFTIGKLGLGLYLSHGSVGSAYGAAGSLVALLAWIFYSAQIFFLGAEFTQLHARKRGRAIQPDKHAAADDDLSGRQVGAST